MQLLTTLTAILLALTPIANADFSLYQVGKGGTGIVANIEGWQVYANTPNTIGCDKVRASINLGQRPDVSGKKTGVRCKTPKGQCGRSGGDDNILELEFNRARAGGGRHHFTYYKDRGGALVGLNGENLGHCTPDGGAQFFCSKGISRVEGTRKLNCKSSIWARDLDN
ncbi:hypothetical protein KC318_g4944 [Hortaea werneckii]|uniref:Uncharacterized protein n=1 Tax=Hortaea werneckii TaxID=91943 RepID=A0A3M6YYB3_HORWE|nr:hypothetical protein KC334_g5270 [Hortaea werneckii]KAI7023241.1 hypothetical protein KC355_g1786 [Hortaea werneckii]KAI7668991.1 hypothetical protein KC318_g4944 [Hortaea werneckii]RMY07741.1 hypothetical protein D0867_09250 [Hortaea werneckii]RMY26641.1 hypothetical protein D0866_10713 [Hortaea werneckii]